jgi:hypothetical protein
MEESTPVQVVHEEPVTIQPVQETAPVYLFSVNTLLTEQEVLLQKEDADRSLANSIASPNVTELGTKLKEWARLGFPYLHTVLSFTFTLPYECSDGVKREIAEYIFFLTGKTLRENIDILQNKLEGIAVHCEYTSSNSFSLRVARA